ncbi:MBL fold metallo-hydrolase [Bradyrhizobium sp. AZCC 1693]|uniref:MBL fold metallo-hydrolase n=1 Tax=Bradyrhizobium sp. AZCC 1693 TaxID=3117029 RepID=UPI002FF370B9
MPVYAYLIEGGAAEPVLVDTGAGDTELIGAELKRFGLAPSDIRAVIFTHLHFDHVGGAALFPTTTTFAVSRRELEFAASGMMRRDYRLADIELLLERTHTPGAMWFFDFQGFERHHILPGISVAHAGGHTEGSTNVFVDTADGIACLCGDVIQDVRMQVIAPPFQTNHCEPRMAGNSGLSQAADRAVMKAVLGQTRWLLPAHDDGFTVEYGRAVGRLSSPKAPGPVEALQ